MFYLQSARGVSIMIFYSKGPTSVFESTVKDIPLGSELHTDCTLHQYTLVPLFSFIVFLRLQLRSGLYFVYCWKRVAWVVLRNTSALWSIWNINLEALRRSKERRLCGLINPMLEALLQMENVIPGTARSDSAYKSTTTTTTKQNPKPADVVMFTSF